MIVNLTLQSWFPVRALVVETPPSVRRAVSVLAVHTLNKQLAMYTHVTCTASLGLWDSSINSLLHKTSTKA